MYIIEVDEFVNVKHIKQFADEVMTVLRTEKDIVIDFTKSKRLDLSVVQVILSLLKTARQLNKTVKFKGVNDTVKKQLKLCGVIR
ncbi:MAG TPA: STAS domain-containing protein [Spirochaetota bacterium]|nr:STAS domain-containing protein [Spirochaetota bacterium]HPP49854.1 STAS domain-containing protein [Spirochaetota bacterium]